MTTLMFGIVLLNWGLFIGKFGRFLVVWEFLWGDDYLCTYFFEGETFKVEFFFRGDKFLIGFAGTGFFSFELSLEDIYFFSVDL
jgi:hypothetical protein